MNAPRRRWYQFSLRTLFVAMLLAGIGMSWIGSELRKSREQRESPQTEWTDQAYLPDGELGSLDCEVWHDGEGRLYYAICYRYVDFAPNLPTFSRTSTWRDGVRELLIDGKKIELSQRRRLLASNPFGRMVEISLSPEEESIVKSHVAQPIWENVVLKRLFRREGRVADGKLNGLWTYSDIDGRKAYEGTYLQGKRDGKWTYYYENGDVRAEMHYKQGKLHGACDYYDTDGQLTQKVTWQNGVPASPGNINASEPGRDQ